jgi:hypothetical protein
MDTLLDSLVRVAKSDGLKQNQCLSYLTSRQRQVLCAYLAPFTDSSCEGRDRSQRQLKIMRAFLPGG